MPSYRLGIDIGGTFTDFTLLEETTGALTVLKTPSVPSKPEQAIFNGLRQLLDEHGIDPGQITYFVHGTTLAVNTIIQRSGAPMALLVTQGFRDILNIGRHRIPDVFNFFTELAVPLLPRSQVHEIPERCLADGSVSQEVDEQAVRDAAIKLRADGIESVAICFLHSYRNPANELRARDILRDAAPDVFISASSEVWPQMREYERALAAVMNGYVGRRMQRYFSELQSGVAALGVKGTVFSTKSNGGIMTAAEAGERPVETLLSGPASGVIGAAYVGASVGIDTLVTFDMGGTSADVAVIEGTPRYSTENHVGDFPVIMPAIDVTSIGAGGGSIAYVDSSGVLKVGPGSAGADPGPACYGLGGTNATVTDAYVCLGILDPERFLGGRLVLRPALAEAALSGLGERLGLGMKETAEAILRVATSQMYSALVPLLARKGIAYESFTMLAFGGGGPCHAFLLARDIGISRVLVPPHPGVLCAAGSLAADMRRDFVRSVHHVLDAGTMGDISAILHALADNGTAWLDAQNLYFVERRVEWSADVRYLGQSFEISVPLTAADLTEDAFRANFHRAYEVLYGYMDSSAALEIRDLRVTAIGVSQRPVLERLEPKSGPPLKRERDIFLDGRTMRAAVYSRDELPAGFKFAGPAIVEQFDTTVFVTPEFNVSVDAYGNLMGAVSHADR